MAGLLVFCVGVFGFAVSCVGSSNYTTADRLSEELMKGYNRRIRPVLDQRKPVHVNISIGLNAIQDFDEVMETFSVVVFLVIVWIDERMRWDPKEYGGIFQTRFKVDDVWHPILINSNAIDNVDPVLEDWMEIKYYSNGIAFVTPTVVLRASCGVDVTHYPFDTQTCHIYLVPFVFDMSEMVINAAEPRELLLTYFYPNGEWEMVSSEVEAEDFVLFYSLHTEITIKRRSLYFVLTLIVPVDLMCALSIVVFLLPVDSGERISYSITILLAIAVFLTLVGDNLPKTSAPMSNLSFYMVSMLILSVLISLAVILNLRLYFKPEQDKIPACIASFVRVITCKRQTSNKETKAENDHLFHINRLHGNQVHERHSDADGYQGNGSARSTFDLVQEVVPDYPVPVTWKDVAGVMDGICFIVSAMLLLASSLTFVLTL